MNETNIQDYQKSNPAGTRTLGKGSASILQMYSVGIAAANLQVGQTELSVFPSESRTYADGEVTDNISDYTTTGVDGNGNNYSEKVTASNAIRAKWLSRNPWLKTPGLVRRGEEVIIWRVGDTDQFYWELMGTSNHLRRRDIMLLVFSNTSDEATTELTGANSVFFEINTMDKHITLMTPTNDGEQCGYALQLNYKDSNFSLSDTLGNGVIMDSVEKLLQLYNADDSTVMIDKTKILIQANDEVKIKTNKLIAETQETQMQGEQFTGNYPTTQWAGTSFTASYAGSTLGVGNGVNFSGGTMNINTEGLFHNGVNVGSDHVHTEQGDGKDTSTPH